MNEGAKGLRSYSGIWFTIPAIAPFTRPEIHAGVR